MDRHEILRTLVDLLPDNIYAKDTDSRFIFGNLAVARRMGAVSPETLIGKTDFDFYPPAQAQNFFEDEQAVIKSGEALLGREERVADQASGEEHWHLTIKVPLCDRTGKVIGIVGISRDITERKLAEEKIVQLNAELECRVQERTAELVHTNTALQKEIGERTLLQAALAAERNLMRTLIDLMPDNIYAKDADSRFLLANKSVARSMGANDAEELLGKTDFDYYPNEQAQSFFADERAVIESGQTLIDREELAYDQATGHQRWLSTTKVPLRDRNGGIIGIVGISRNITARKISERELRLRNRAIESSTNAVLITDCSKPNNPIEYVNPAFERITGYLAEEAIGKNISFLLGSEQNQRGVESIHTAFQEQRQGRAALHQYRKDGKPFWSDLQVAPVRDEDTGLVSHFVCILNDITESRNYEEQLKRQASYDHLTGLPNRRLLVDLLNHAMSLAQRADHIVGIAFFDLDRFKFINDTLGHSIGDELLLIVSERLKASVRKSDTVARLGGDEFVLLLPGQMRPEHAVMADTKDSISFHSALMEVLRRILHTVAQPITLGGREFRVTGSAGVAFFPQDGLDVDTLLKNADAAMYRAKEKGGNNVQFYTTEMNARMAEQLALEGLLRNAVDQGEFTLAYQPKIDVRKRTVSGAEALLRWNNKDLGSVSPAIFIPILERTGLINQVGRWVMAKALADRKHWRAAGLPVPRIAVNVSQVQLDHKDFVDTVKDVLAENSDLADGLELEITESLIMKNAEVNISKLDAIKDMGVEISIDDFGTGYSSLSQLANLPVNTLKIDRAFTAGLTTSSNGLNIVSAIISLARSMKLTVIAEGVETDEQLNLLKQLKCDEIQGFLISRPLALTDYLAWQKTFSRRPTTAPRRRKKAKPR